MSVGQFSLYSSFQLFLLFFILSFMFWSKGVMFFLPRQGTTEAFVTNIIQMKLNKIIYLTQLTTRSVGVVSLACMAPMCSLPGGHSLCLAFGSFFYPHSSPFILPLINQCGRWLVPLVWGLMAGVCEFASHGGMTLSRGWLCQRWKPLDIPGTYLR